MGALLLFLSTLLLSSLFYYLLYAKKIGKDERPPLPPGPKGFPILGNLLQLGPMPHRDLQALTKVYGPLIRIRLGSTEAVVVASAAVARQFFGRHDVNFSNRPSCAVGDHMSFNYQDLVFAPYGPRWRMLRKLCASHLFSQKALDDLRPARQTEISLLAQTLCAHAGGEAVDLGQALNVCTANALSMAIFSQRLFGHSTKLGAATEFKGMVMEFMMLAVSFSVSDLVPALRWFDLQRQNRVRKMKLLHHRFDLFFDKVVVEHSISAKEDDLLSVLMRLKDEDGVDGTKLTNTDIKALLFDLFTAGTDTSAISVEWALSEMIRHPEIYKKAQMEIDTVVGKDRLVCESDLAHLPLLQAIVKETLRLHPPAPLSVPRVSTETCEINGYTIPKNAVVFLNIWAIGHDPAIWPDPSEFRPSRFLPGGGHENLDVRGKDFELLPFGAGRRICVGISLGQRLVQLLTATLVHAFDWVLPKGQVAEKIDMEAKYGLTLHRVVPLMAHPVPRLAGQAYEIEC